jgi:hypothetical protein
MWHEMNEWEKERSKKEFSSITLKHSDNNIINKRVIHAKIK